MAYWIVHIPNEILAVQSLGEIQLSKYIELSNETNKENYDITDGLDLPVGKNTLFILQIGGLPSNSATISYTVNGFKDTDTSVVKSLILPAIPENGNTDLLCLAKFGSGLADNSTISLISPIRSLVIG